MESSTTNSIPHDSISTSVNGTEGVENEEGSMSMSLSELITTLSYKWIFVGGKGGVGKTTTACSIGIQLSKRRESVLILSTDPAHNLSDAFAQKLTNTPKLINGFTNLYAMEIESRMNENCGFRLNEDEGWSKVLPELLQALPGIDEALSFTELMQSVESMKYSVIVFDTAPTGHTMRLLSFPDVLEKGLKKFMDMKSKLKGAMSMLNTMTGQDINEEDISSKLDNLKAVTTSVRETFQNPCKTTFVCVCIAEFLSLYETERLVQELSRQSIDCSNIVVNQVLFPIEKEVDDKYRGVDTTTDFTDEAITTLEKNQAVNALIKQNHYLREMVDVLGKSYKSRRRMQSKYLMQIKELYANEFHVVCMGQRSCEVRGLDLLNEFSGKLVEESNIPILDEAEFYENQ